MRSSIGITKALLMISAVGFSALLALLLALGAFTTPAKAAPGVLYVHPTCAGAPSPCYTSIQDAVDAASPGDKIHIATGIYTGVRQRNGITQVV